MPVIDIYSRRRKKQLGHVPDVYEYDTIPEELRIQIFQIWGEAIGIPYHSGFDNTPREFKRRTTRSLKLSARSTVSTYFTESIKIRRMNVTPIRNSRLGSSQKLTPTACLTE